MSSPESHQTERGSGRGLPLRVRSERESRRGNPGCDGVVSMSFAYMDSVEVL